MMTILCWDIILMLVISLCSDLKCHLSYLMTAGSLVANYPYDGIHSNRLHPSRHASYNKSPDDKVFKHLAEAFSWVRILK